jgi:hypothetical protein
VHSSIMMRRYLSRGVYKESIRAPPALTELAAWGADAERVDFILRALRATRIQDVHLSNCKAPSSLWASASV